MRTVTPLLTDLLNVLACSIHVSPLLFLSALPPLSQQELKHDAQVVLVGTVSKIDEREVKVADGTDVAYTATLTVKRVEKSLLELKDKTVKVHYRRTGKRPPGWTGPAGQHAYPKEGETIRVFGRVESAGTISLIEPNGWEKSGS